MGAVMDGEATPAQLAALLMGLRMRGETVDELAGFAAAMRERVAPRRRARAGAIDVVGTGGDGSGTFNISTTAALVVAAAGVPVAKHGNRAITSQGGLGRRARRARRPDRPRRRRPRPRRSATHRLRVHVRAELPPGDEARRSDAPRDRRPDRVQPARPADEPGRHDPPAAGRRRPGRGRADRRGRPALGTERTFVIHGDGVDELPLDGSGVLYDVSPDGDRAARRSTRVEARVSASRRRARLAGGTPDDNARIDRGVLRGEPGARRDVVLLNAGAALLVAGGGRAARGRHRRAPR